MTRALLKPISTSVVELQSGCRIYAEEIVRQQRGLKTMMFINGALSSTSTQHWAIESLPDLNLIMYDLPHIGRSRKYNSEIHVFDTNRELCILEQLIDIYKPDYLFSISWGGLATLLAIAMRPASVEKVIVGSFSATINEATKHLLTVNLDNIRHRRFTEAAVLMNETLGEYLLPLHKKINIRYLESMSEYELNYTIAQIEQVLSLDIDAYARQLCAIEAEVLFVNGTLDRYTTVYEAEWFSRHIKRVTTEVVNAGHFLCAENKRAAAQTAGIIMRFLEGNGPPPPTSGAPITASAIGIP